MEYRNKGGNFGSFLTGMIAATALGGYLLFGSRNSKRNRQKVEDWMEDAKDEVAMKVRKVRRLTRDKYNEIIDSVSNKYAEMKEVGKEKTDKLRDELQSRWDEIAEDVRKEGEDE